MVTQKLLKEIFNYKNGQLLRRTNKGNKKSGCIAGCFGGNDYSKEI